VKLSGNKKLKWIEGVIVIFLLVITINFSNTQWNNKICKKCIISIVDDKIQRFVRHNNITEVLSSNNISPLGTKLSALISRNIANLIIKGCTFVGDIIVYKTLNAELILVVFPRKPIARISCISQPDKYIDKNGLLLPMSDQYTDRVLIVDTAQRIVVKKFTENTYWSSVLELIKYIYENIFWRYQIAHMNIGVDSKITLCTHLGNESIEFGLPIDLEKKFAKLGLYYKNIVSYKGWNKYKRINLEFQNQILCE